MPCGLDSRLSWIFLKMEILYNDHNLFPANLPYVRVFYWIWTGVESYSTEAIFAVPYVQEYIIIMTPAKLRIGKEKKMFVGSLP